MAKRIRDMAGFFEAKAEKDKNTTRTAQEMPSHGEDRQDYLAYLSAREEGVTQAQLAGLTTDEVLSLPPPRDEPEYSASGGIRFAPLIGGTTSDERSLVDERLQQNAAKASKKALAAGKPDPWAGAPHPPHHHIPGLWNPRHKTPEEGRGVTAGVPKVGGKEKAAATQTVPLVAASRVESQRKLRGNSRGPERKVMGVGRRSAPTVRNGNLPGALSPIQEVDNVEEISRDNFPVASIEAAPTNPAGPRGTKRSLSSAAGQPPAKKARTLGSTLGVASTIIDHAAINALADARPEPVRSKKRRASDVEGEEDRAVKRPKTTRLEAQPIRRSTRIQSREPSVAVVPAPNPPPRRAASVKAGLPKESSSSQKKPAAASQPKVRQSARSESKASVTKVTKNRKTPVAKKAKTQTDAAAKPKRKKVKKACEECRRKHLSCVHGENAP